VVNKVLHHEDILELNNHHAMKTWRSGVTQFLTFLTSVLDGGEWSASPPGQFTTGEGVPSSHWIGGWVGPTASLDAVARRNIPCLSQELDCGCPAHSLVTLQTELSQFLRGIFNLRLLNNTLSTAQLCNIK